MILYKTKVISILIILLTLFFTVACAPKTRAEIKVDLAKKGIQNDVWYLKEDVLYTQDYVDSAEHLREHPLRRGEKVLLLDYYPYYGIAETNKGLINIKYLEAKPSKVYLNIITPKGSIIKILNIRPKYKDYIYLKPGKYLIEVKKPGFILWKKWINIPNTIIWNKKYLKKYKIKTSRIYVYNNLSWYKDALQNNSFYKFKKLSGYCKYLSIPLSKNYQLTGFRVPTLDEVYFGNKYNKFFENDTGFYYTSTKVSYGDEKLMSGYYNSYYIEGDIKSHARFKVRYHNNKMTIKPTKGDLDLVGTSNILCVNEYTPTNLKLITLIEGILSNKHSKKEINQAYSEAFHIKYGKPIIKSIICKNHQNSCYIRVVSQRGGIDATINIPVDQKDYKHFKYILRKSIIPNLTIEMKKENNKYKIKKIVGLKNSHNMVLEDQYKNAKYSITKLNNFIKNYQNDKYYIKKAQKRIFKLKKLFKGYTPVDIMTLKGCHFFYPRKLIDDGLYNGVDLTIWNKIDGDAKICRKGYLYGNVVLRFSSDKHKLYTELSGKMKYGLFVGKVKYEGSTMSFDNIIRPIKFGTFQAPKIEPNSDYHIGKPKKGK